ncbi:hypothetical protein GALL_202800 [mine drainage metagenome]|uniref:DUF2782 domain-containing protein n=1 Tax=mine drainage metagenome TaxID=410659 RepID=A0A1J5S025_9ZZZZ
MRRTLLILALLALPAAAQQPAGRQPLPELPPPPPAVQADPGLEPQVTITQRGQDKIEEYRIHNKLYMIKVTPPHGKPYYLVDQKGDGNMVRQGTLNPRLSVPMWVIKTF